MILPVSDAFYSECEGPEINNSNTDIDITHKYCHTKMAHLFLLVNFNLSNVEAHHYFLKHYYQRDKINGTPFYIKESNVWMTIFIC